MRFVLVPGAGGLASYWHPVAARLEAAGARAVAVDLPGPDETAGLREYAEIVLAAIDGDAQTVLVAQSLGGFTAAMVAERAPLRALVLVNAMVPVPGERPGEWWDAVHAVQARVTAAERNGYAVDYDDETYFLHDVDPAAVAEHLSAPRPEADIVFTSTCDFTAWPSIPIHVIAGAEDRFFPLELQQQVARERLGLEPTVLPGGHLMALSQPDRLAEHLLRAL